MAETRRALTLAVTREVASCGREPMPGEGGHVHTVLRAPFEIPRTR
jgi:hypothetical protein